MDSTPVLLWTLKSLYLSPRRHRGFRCSLVVLVNILETQLGNPKGSWRTSFKSSLWLCQMIEEIHSYFSKMCCHISACYQYKNFTGLKIKEFCLMFRWPRKIKFSWQKTCGLSQWWWQRCGHSSHWLDAYHMPNLSRCIWHAHSAGPQSIPVQHATVTSISGKKLTHGEAE